MSDNTLDIFLMPTTLTDRIIACDTLPVLPAIAMQIVELHNQEDLYAAKVASVISQDPTLVAKLLQITNSSFFPFRREVTNVVQAITILGVNLAMSVALSSSLIKMLRDAEITAIDIDHDYFWRKNILTALIASEVGGSKLGLDRGDAYVASLLQDVGILVFSEVLGDEYRTVYNNARSHYDLIIMEQRNWGMDHAEVGAILLAKWQLPNQIVEVVQHSHSMLKVSPETAEVETNLIYISSLAGIVAEQWLLDQPEHEPVSSTLLDALSYLGEANYAEVISRVIDAIPSAEAVFNMDLLSSAKIEKIA